MWISTSRAARSRSATGDAMSVTRIPGSDGLFGTSGVRCFLSSAPRPSISLSAHPTLGRQSLEAKSGWRWLWVDPDRWRGHVTDRSRVTADAAERRSIRLQRETDHPRTLRHRPRRRQSGPPPSRRSRARPGTPGPAGPVTAGTGTAVTPRRARRPRSFAAPGLQRRRTAGPGQAVRSRA